MARRTLCAQTGDRRVELYIPGGAPEWLPAAAEVLLQSLALPQDWDSYGAARLSPEAVVHAWHLLVPASSIAVPPPHVAPAASGGVLMEWQRGGHFVEVEVFRSGRYEIGFEDESAGEVWERTVLGDAQVLQSTLARLAEQER